MIKRAVIRNPDLRARLAAPSWAASDRGVIEGLPRELYHHARGMCSKSQVDELKSPKHWLHWLTHSKPETEAFAMGDALHTRVLEPDVYAKRFRVMPAFGRKKRDLQAAAAMKAEARAEGFTLVTVRIRRQVDAMLDSLMSERIPRALIERARCELTLHWTCQHTGLKVKSRLDGHDDRSGVTFDLKSTLDASPSGFAKTARKFQYHVQDAMYSRAALENQLESRAFVFIAVEKTEPYAVGLYQIDKPSILAAEEIYIDAMQTLAHCLEHDEFPAYSPKIEQISIAGAASRTPRVSASQWRK